MDSIKVNIVTAILVCFISLFHFGKLQGGTCGFNTILDDFDLHEITSPGHPNTYPQDTECRWQIDVKKYQQNKTLSLNFVTVNIEESENCTSEYIKITTNTSHELGMLCGQQQKEYKFFIDSLIIVFKTGPSRVGTRQGFKLVYKMLNESSCSETVSVQGSGQITNSNFDYPSFQRCTYLLQHSAPDGLIELYLTDWTHWLQYDCTREYILVYEGENEDGPLMSKYCGGASLRLFSFNFFVVIVSWQNPIDISISYYEVACHYTRDVGMEAPATIHFNGPSDSHTCVWTAYPLFASRIIIVTFTNVSVDCANSKITVYNVPHRWSYCGNEGRIYMTSFGKVVVASIGLLGGSKPTSFNLNFRLEYVPDCGVGRTIKAADDFVRTLESPLHPARYPSDLNCVWEIRAPYANDTIKINFTEIDLGTGCKDELRIYNGAVYNFTLPKPDFVICGANGSNMASFESKVGIVTVLFITDGPIGGTGFKLSYVSPYKDLVPRPRPPAPSNAGLIAGAFFGVFFVVVIIVFVTVCSVWYCRKKKRAANMPNIPVHVFMSSTDPSVPKLLGRRNTLEGTSNPGYEGSVNTSSTNKDQTADVSTTSLPPSYSTSMFNDTAVSI